MNFKIIAILSIVILYFGPYLSPVQSIGKYGSILLACCLLTGAVFYDYKKEHNMNFDIEIDGGVNADNLHRPLEAGANIIVAGSAIYGKEDIPSEIKKFKEIFSDIL